MMSRRITVPLVVALLALVAGVAAVWASPAPGPSGERLVGGTAAKGGSVVEPVYDDMTGVLTYVSTPRGTPDPVKSPPIAAAPIYLPVYPVGSTVGLNYTLNCQDTVGAPYNTTENCPDHGPAVAGATQAIMGSILGAASPYVNGVIGHDHLMAGPGSHGDFNIAWVPTLVLFTNSTAANTHVTLLSQITAMKNSGDVILVPLDGTNGTPNLTFHCSVVPAAVYKNGIPYVLG
jgi:hypothetical protein